MKMLRIFLSGFLYLVLSAGTESLADDDTASAIADPETIVPAPPDAKTGETWYQLAISAREAGDTHTATDALKKAEEMQFSAVRISIERARIDVVRNDPDAAVAKLRQLFDNGFPVVAIFTGDPVLGGLAGHEGFDALIAEMTTAAYPCENQEQFREFDFWVGEWDVHIADGTPAGHNRIEAVERGCVLIENWVSATGGSGMSINYLDKATDEWVQIWNAEGGSQINVRGGLTDDGMLMTGQIHYVASGTTAPFRALWTLLEDGRVRQFFETSNDDGESWVPWFEGFYTRVEAGAQLN
jgi:hypothetical protein